MKGLVLEDLQPDVRADTYATREPSGAHTAREGCRMSSNVLIVIATSGAGG